MFTIEMLPAEYGDCLLITYGTARKPHRILVDGGTPKTLPRLVARLRALPEKERHFELVLVTHIDDDHIGGMLALLKQNLITWDDFWFNGWHHLAPGRVPPVADGETIPGLPSKGKPAVLSPKQGRDLASMLYADPEELAWNVEFNGGAVVVPDTGPLPTVTLEGGMKLTLLSPLQVNLTRLDQRWPEALRDYLRPARPVRPPTLGGRLDLGKLASSNFKPDHAPANGSSIAVLAEFNRKRCLLTGDAYATTLGATLARLAGRGKKVALDAFKLPHHGSRSNISNEVLELVDCNRYLVSTNGVKFNHPDVEAIARVVVNGGAGVQLYFNYDSSTTKRWKDPALQEGPYPFTATYPRKNESAVIEL